MRLKNKIPNTEKVRPYLEQYLNGSITGSAVARELKLAQSSVSAAFSKLLSTRNTETSKNIIPPEEFKPEKKKKFFTVGDWSGMSEAQREPYEGKQNFKI